MLPDISFATNSLVINQLALDSVDSCLGNTLQILRKYCYALQKFGKLTTQVARIWVVKFSKFNFKIVYLAEFITDFNSLDLKI